MKISKDIILSLSSEGRITLQVPEIVINFGGGDIEEEEAPDVWFVRLNGALPSRQGYLFLSRAGWNANRDAMWTAFDAANHGPHARHPGMTRAEYEAEIEKEFADREKAIQRKVKSLKKKLLELESYVA